MPFTLFPIEQGSARVTVEVSGQRRALISLTQTKNGSVIVSLLGRQEFIVSKRSEPDMHVSLPAHITQHKFSIHPSKNDPLGNQIHHSIELSGNQKINTYNYTKALCGISRFAPLCFFRTNRLEHCSYDLKNDKKSEVYLGQFDPTMFSMYIAVFACKDVHKSIEFESVYGVNYIPFKFEGVVVIVMWSYALMPTAASSYGHAFTVKNGLELNNLHENINRIIGNGFTRRRTMTCFFGSRNSLRNSLVSHWLKYGTDKKDTKILQTIHQTKKLGFFFDGVMGTHEWFEFLHLHPEINCMAIS